MFTRDSTTGHAPLEPVAGARPARPPSAHVQSAEPASLSSANDLRIGQSLTIISRGTLQVDGEVEGDVGGAEIIIGEEAG
jgi:cytoskeletal protein CcmA (bactofilin family)